MTGDSVTVFVDVDGVINALPDSDDNLAHWPAESWHRDLVYQPALGVAGTVTWSTCVVDALRAIECRPHVAMVWCTTWLDAAAEYLAPVIGIGGDWPHVAPGSAPRYSSWKARRVQESLYWPGRRVVWIDDDIDAWTAILTRAGGAAELAWIDDRALTICPPSRSGLLPSHVAQIEAFL